MYASVLCLDYKMQDGQFPDNFTETCEQMKLAQEPGNCKLNPEVVENPNSLPYPQPSHNLRVPTPN